MNIRRRFERPIGNRRYKKLFIIAVEGRKTEPQYFALLSTLNSIVKIHCLKGNNSSPLQVLQRMKKYLREESLQKFDEAGLVIDKDAWPDNHLKQLFEWKNLGPNHGVAVSNPNFEYWLLLHFEDPRPIKNSRDSLRLLKKYLPNYEKNVDPHIIKEIYRDRVKRKEFGKEAPRI